MENDELKTKEFGITIEISCDPDPDSRFQGYDIAPLQGQTYQVRRGGREVGKLRLSGQDSWEWTEGSLSQDCADAIGKAINAHNRGYSG